MPPKGVGFTDPLWGTLKRDTIPSATTEIPMNNPALANFEE